MKQLILLLLACLAIACWGKDPPPDPSNKPDEVLTFERRDSPAALLEQNTDGTLLVTIKPQVYFDELGCVMLSDGQGNTFSLIHYIIAFSLEESRYWTIWGSSPSGGPAVKLDPKKNYKCLVKVLDTSQDGEDVSCSILKIWEGEELLYDREKMAPVQERSATAYDRMKSSAGIL